MAEAVSTAEPARLRALVERAGQLAVFSRVLDDEVGRAFLALLVELAAPRPAPAGLLSAYARLFGLLADEHELYAGEPVGDAWQNHLLDRLLVDENPFSRKAARAPLDGMGPALLAQVRRDLAVLQALFQLDGRTVAAAVSAVSPNGRAGGEPVVGWNELRALTPSAASVARAAWARGTAAGLKRRLAAADDWGACLAELAGHYAAGGAGLFGRFRAFRWNPAAGELEGVAEPDPVRLEDLVGYEAERELILRNTEHLVAGFPANNVLLYGDRGTGKSSTVKALLNEYGDRGLRLIEVPKEALHDFPRLLRVLRDRPERFVLFVDDLSFEESETAYKALKAVLEGGLEVRPANVVVYATSNRRHLVGERFSDRRPADEDEVRPQDVLEEKLSLADRFGITAIFPAPDQERYLAIVAALAARRGLALSDDELRRRALRWATWQNARSGRTARQLVDFLAAEVALGRVASDE